MPPLAPGLLPRDGQVQLADLIKCLTASARQFAVSSELRCRTLLAARHRDATWVHVATVARVLPVEVHDHSDLDFPIGHFRILGAQASIEQITDESSLSKVLGFWKGMAQPFSDVNGYQSANVLWQPSRNAWSVNPNWLVTMQNEGDPLSWDRAVARGPFLSRERQWFARDLPSLASEWMDCPPVIRADSNAPYVALVIPDRRAWFRDIDASGQRLVVSLDGNRIDDLLQCSIDVEDLDGIRHKLLAKVSHGMVSTELPRAPRALDLHLWNAEGEILDHYQERDGYSSWGSSALQVRAGETATDLLAACELGEGEQVEFKAWVPCERQNPKSVELLEAVVAFANRKGGRLFIGVDDSTDVVGVERELQRSFKNLSASDLPGARDAYVRVLCCRRLNTGHSTD